MSAGNSIGAALMAGVLVLMCVVVLDTAGEVLWGKVPVRDTPTGLIGVVSLDGVDMVVAALACLWSDGRQYALEVIWIARTKDELGLWDVKDRLHHSAQRP